jgi:hypothetical protein
MLHAEAMAGTNETALETRERAFNSIRRHVPVDVFFRRVIHGPVFDVQTRLLHRAGNRYDRRPLSTLPAEMPPMPFPRAGPGT